MAEMDALKKQIKDMVEAMAVANKRSDDISERNDILARDLAAATAEIKSAKGHTIVIKDKKLSKLSSRDGDIDVDEWISDVQHHFDSKTLSEEQMKEFIYDNIKGEVKDEIRFHGDELTASGMLERIRSSFGQSFSLAKLQEKFFARNMLKTESVFSYALALMKLSERIRKKDPSKPKDPRDFDSILKERFTEGMVDEHLQRELRRLNTAEPGLSFYEFRTSAVDWLGEKGLKPSPVNCASDSINLDSEMVSKLNNQEKMISELKSQLANVNVFEQRSSGNRGQRNYESSGNRASAKSQPHGFGSEPQTYGFQPHFYRSQPQTYGSQSYGFPPLSYGGQGYGNQYQPQGGLPSRGFGRSTSSGPSQRESGQGQGRGRSQSAGFNRSVPSQSSVPNQRSNPGQNRERKYYNGPLYTPDGQMICFKCQGLNHKAVNCMKTLN